MVFHSQRAMHYAAFEKMIRHFSIVIHERLRCFPIVRISLQNWLLSAEGVTFFFSSPFHTAGK